MKTEAFITIVLLLEKGDNGSAVYLRTLNSLMEGIYTDWEVLVLVPPPGLGAEQTRNLLETPYVRLLTLSTSKRAIQIIGGLENSIGDYVVITDYRHDPPEEIPRMLTTCREHGGAVFGLDTEMAKPGAFHRFCRGLFCRYAEHHLHPDFSQWQDVFGNADFHCLSRGVVNDMIKYESSNPYLKLALARTGHSQSVHRYRGLHAEQRNRAPLVDDISRAVEITISNTRHPLRFVTQLSLLAAILNCVYIFYIFGVFFIKRKPAEGWTTLSLQQSSMFLAIFIVLIVMCEYIGQILQESHRRPKYHILNEVCAEQIVNRQRLNTTPHEQ
jgi:polyisoprenyl-phosphate glycosyltransferase